MARRGEARHGTAWRGKARQGFILTKKVRGASDKAWKKKYIT